MGGLLAQIIMSENKASSVEIHKLKKELEFLESKKGKGTELVSLYIPPNKAISDVVAQMRQEHSQAMNIKSARTRKNVQSALEVIMQRLKMFKKPPERGLVLLVGTIPHGTKVKREVYVIEPPEQVQTYIYHCNSQFLIDPLKEMLAVKGSFGLLLVDRSEATIGLVRGKRIETLKKMTSNVPRKHGRGGQSQRRFERLIEIAAHEYFKRVGEKASKIFLSIPDLRGVIVGGPGPTKEFFIEEEYLHYEIENKILEIINTSYTDEFGLTEVVEKASGVFEELEINKEKKLVQRFLREVVKDYGLSAYGINEVRELVKSGAVDTVLFSEDVESFRIQIVCSSCDYQIEKTVKDIKMFQVELNNMPCPNCREKALAIESFKSTLEELEEVASKTNTNIEIISNETEEGQQLKAFGGIGALLRFRQK